jgi:hypothetical protein
MGPIWVVPTSAKSVGDQAGPPTSLYACAWGTATFREGGASVFWDCGGPLCDRNAPCTPRECYGACQIFLKRGWTRFQVVRTTFGVVMAPIWVVPTSAKSVGAQAGAPTSLHVCA